MAVTSAEPIRETHNDQYPLLMERHDVRVNEEHRIDIQRCGEPSSSGSSDQDSRATSSGEPPPLGESSSTSPSRTNSRSSSFIRRNEGVGRRNYSPFNSGFWISVELIFTLSLIIASTTVLYFSRNEHPQAPLFTWVVGYTAGCLASLPVLYWRFLNRNQGTDRTGTQSSSASPRANSAPSQSSDVNGSISRSEEEDVHRNMSAVTSEGQTSDFANSRTGRIMDHFKLALDCFFVVWFIVGTVWIFGGHVTAAEAPHLYRLCIVYLTLSCIGYAMPFILCGMICCCLPCIISVLGIREELNQVRGASDEAINALPTYKFKSEKESTCIEESNDQERGGSVGAGTEKERIISVEDAICCICLERYLNEEELRELPCTHLFHAECVDKWLKINATCPLCKFEICEKEDDVVSSPSQAQPATET